MKPSLPQSNVLQWLISGTQGPRHGHPFHHDVLSMATRLSHRTQRHAGPVATPWERGSARANSPWEPASSAATSPRDLHYVEQHHILLGRAAKSNGSPASNWTSLPSAQFKELLIAQHSQNQGHPNSLFYIRLETVRSQL